MSEIIPYNQPDSSSSGNGDLRKEWIALGSGLVGNTIGALLGALYGGPGGAISGAFVGTSLSSGLKNMGEEIWNRRLTKMEKRRVSAVILAADQAMQRAIANGITARNEHFLEDGTAGTENGRELVEVVLTAAQREPEERKIEYFGELVTSVALSPGVGPGLANQLILTAQSLSYRQLCLLRLTSEASKYNLRITDYRAVTNMGLSQYAVILAVFQLQQLNLVSFSEVFALFPSNIIPSKLQFRPFGQTLFDGMDLKRIPDGDVEELAAYLR
jgi:hypothetical protein